jgi:hypothetical protein
MTLRLRHLSLALLASAAGALAACSTTPGLVLSATPNTIGGDGESPVTIKASVTRGGAPVDSATVHVTATSGVLDGSEPGTPGLADVATSAGDAIVKLTVPRVGRGIITINASVSLDGVSVSQTSTVTLTPAGGKADALLFTCDQQNVGGLVTGRTDAVHVHCNATASVGGKPIKNASIEAYAEAGSLEWLKDDSGAQQLIYTIAAGARPPLDVDPFDGTGKPRAVCPSACVTDPTTCDGEPCWVDNGTTRNPRDGVATLMVAVPAVAGFFDGNTAYGEPFVDADDDGLRGSSESFIDVNGNGKYDDANGASAGQKQDVRMLWKSVRIIWSGSADMSATAHGSKITGKASGTSLTSGLLRVHDRNYNKLAAVGAAGTDVVDLGGDCTQSATFTASPARLKMIQEAKTGILFGPDEAHPLSGPGFPTTYRQGTEYPVSGSVDDASMKPICTVTASVNRSYDPGAPGFSPTGTSDAEEIIGSISF